jgi:hypothetical protein
MCDPGWYTCPVSAGGGCCPQGYSCRTYDCAAETYIPIYAIIVPCLFVVFLIAGCCIQRRRRQMLTLESAAMASGGSVTVVHNQAPGVYVVTSNGPTALHGSAYPAAQSIPVAIIVDAASAPVAVQAPLASRVRLVVPPGLGPGDRFQAQLGPNKRYDVVVPPNARGGMEIELDV